ncbi:MAG: LacI family DNA-binding transcriptional regulator [Pseudomonadota bacterium]
MPRVTISDVSRNAGVSIKTVSRVINGEANVRDETRDRVQDAIVALGYKPSVAARTLAGRRSYQIGLLYDNPSVYYTSDIQKGASGRSLVDGYRVLFQSCDLHGETLAADVGELIDHNHIDGIILTPPLTESTAILDELIARKLPFVRVAPGGDLDLSPAARIDDTAASTDMTNYLVDLGHRRIAFIKGHPDHPCAPQRLQGFIEAMRASSLTLDERLIVDGQFSFESGIAAGRRLLTMERPPTAVFASNDDMAAGVLTVAHGMKLRIPEDLSVAGFDDTDVARIVWPQLTTIRQPTPELAASAADLLLKSIAGDLSEPLRELDYELLVRESTGPTPS